MTHIHKSIFFRIFDKTFTESTHQYEFHEAENDAQLNEIHNNHRAVINALNVNHLLVIKEVHGNAVLLAQENHDFTTQMEADACVTTIPNLALSIQTADCVPVLLASHNGLVIGGAHCGWRSAKADILKNTVECMKQNGADSIQAIIGPAIHQVNYEVDHVFYDDIVEAGNYAHLFIVAEKAGHYYFDLPGFVILKLNDLGVTEIMDCCDNTYSNPDKYFSYRRDLHLGVKYRQNILSTIFIHE